MFLSDSQRMYRAIYTHIEKLWNFDPSKRQSNNLNILCGFIGGILQSKQVKNWLMLSVIFLAQEKKKATSCA